MDVFLKVVLVEDNVIVQKSVEQICHWYGHEIVSYNSAEAMLARPRNNPDCYVFDFRLARMSGMQLLTTLRNDGDDTPAVLISGNFDEATVATVQKLGRAVCLNKPFRPTEFLDTLRKLCVPDEDQPVKNPHFESKLLND